MSLIQMRKASIFSLCVLFCCSGRPSHPERDSFNVEAASYFSKSFDSLDLTPLSSYEKCILGKTILNDLDELNNYKRTLLCGDRFTVRTYDDPYLQLPFTFVLDNLNQKMYFLWVPHLKEHLFDVSYAYEQTNDSIFTLKEPAAAVRVGAPLIDRFLSDQDLSIKTQRSFLDAVQFSNAFLEEIFKPVLAHRISIAEFEQDLVELLNSGSINEASYENLRTTMIQPVLRENMFDIEVFRLQEAGHVMVVHRADSVTGDRFSLQIYYLPKLTRYWNSRGVTSRYRDCR